MNHELVLKLELVRQDLEERPKTCLKINVIIAFLNYILLF